MGKPYKPQKGDRLGSATTSIGASCTVSSEQFRVEGLGHMIGLVDSGKKAFFRASGLWLSTEG